MSSPKMAVKNVHVCGVCVYFLLEVDEGGVDIV